jgi:hypothetical protein
MNINQIIDKVSAIDTTITLKDNTTKWTNAGLNTAIDFVNKTSSIALDIAAIVGIIMIFYTALLYVGSFGEEAKAESAKKTLLWAAIGTLVVLAARIIIGIVSKLLG